MEHKLYIELSLNKPILKTLLGIVDLRVSPPLLLLLRT